jgi:hypothetical protein
VSVEVVRAEPGPLTPALIGDGGGLPFPPARLDEAARTPLDPSDLAVSALLRQIDFSRRRRARGGLFRRGEQLPDLSDEEKLRGWRLLAETDDEILFGRGAPPRLATAAVTRNRGDRWTLLGVSIAKPLRAVRAGIRASSWRPDPDFPVAPGDTRLHILLTEQTMASGRLAADRILPPEVAFEEGRLIMRCFVRPLEGYTGRSSRHETPVLVELPEPIGERELIDGAVFWAPPEPLGAKRKR